MNNELEIKYDINDKKPVDKEWVQRQFENFWLKIKAYIDDGDLKKLNFQFNDNGELIVKNKNDQYEKNVFYCHLCSPVGFRFRPDPQPPVIESHP